MATLTRSSERASCWQPAPSSPGTAAIRPSTASRSHPPPLSHAPGVALARARDARVRSRPRARGTPHRPRSGGRHRGRPAGAARRARQDRPHTGGSVLGNLGALRRPARRELHVDRGEPHARRGAASDPASRPRRRSRRLRRLHRSRRLGWDSHRRARRVAACPGTTVRACGTWLSRWWSPTVAVAVGTAAGMAASSGLLFSPVLFAALQVGSSGQDAVPAAVLASVAAWLTLAAAPRGARHSSAATWSSVDDTVT